LAARGHDVTLFGAGTRTGTAARFVGTVPELQHERLGQGLPELVHVARTNRLIADGDFDVVHDHTVCGPVFAPQRSTPTVATIHGSPTGELGDYLKAVDRTVGLVAISHAQRQLGAGLPWAATVHNGLGPFGPTKQAAATGPVLWLARFSADKGPDLAIKVCREAGLPLVLAGKCKEAIEQKYLDEVVRPMLGPDVELIVNADGERAIELLLDARCLLLPIRWEEPFGMVMIEAMATGTPVVALNRGSVPEVVRHGETGFVFDDPTELPAALHEVSRLDPAKCAEHVRTSFSADAMAARYERVYETWAGTNTPPPTWSDLAVRVG
jgi:glycosyltransferase involved in cell wall biosynthesis